MTLLFVSGTAPRRREWGNKKLNGCLFFFFLFHLVSVDDFRCGICCLLLDADMSSSISSLTSKRKLLKADFDQLLPNSANVSDECGIIPAGR